MAGMDPEAYLNAVQFIEQLDKRYENNREVGWVYAMRNEELQKRLLKIGITRRPPGPESFGDGYRCSRALRACLLRARLECESCRAVCA